MSIEKYDVSEEAAFDAHPMQQLIVPDSGGEYVKFEDVRKLLNAVYDKNRDFGSSEADASVYDTIQDLMTGMGIDPLTEMKR